LRWREVAEKARRVGVHRKWEQKQRKGEKRCEVRLRAVGSKAACLMDDMARLLLLGGMIGVLCWQILKHSDSIFKMDALEEVDGKAVVQPCHAAEDRVHVWSTTVAHSFLAVLNF
jgi:hypothetical protein